MRWSLLIYLLSVLLPAAKAQDVPVPVLLARIEHSQPDTNRVALLLQAGCFYLLKPGNIKSDLDSGFFYFNQGLALSRTLHSAKWINEALKWKGDCYLEGDDLIPGKASFQEVIAYYQRIGDKRGEATTLIRLRNCITYDSLAFVFEKFRCDEKARLLFRQLNDKIGEADTWLDEAQCDGVSFPRTGQVLPDTVAGVMRSKAYSLYREAHDTIDEINAREAVVFSHLRDKKANRGESEMQIKELIMAEKAFHYTGLKDTYYNLKGFYDSEDDFEKVIYYDFEMIKNAEANGDRENIKRTYLEVEGDFYDEGSAEKCIFYGQKVMAMSEEDGHFDCYLRALRLLTDKLSLSGRASEALSLLTRSVRKHPPTNTYDRSVVQDGFARCYTDLGAYKAAEKCLLRLRDMQDSIEAEGISTRPALFILNRKLGDLYILMGDYKKANVYMQKLESGLDKDLSGISVYKYHLARFKVDSALGNYASAFRHFELYQRIKDSLFSVEKVKQYEELQVKYDGEQKDKDLRGQADSIQLLKKQTQLQESEAEKSNIIRKVMVGGLAALLSLAGVFYNRFRLKRRKNLQLEVKQAEISAKNVQLEKLLHENEWLLREVHHRVKNNLQVVMSLLNSQSAYLQDEQALNAVMESRHRVQAMSLIHQRLYQSSNVSVIPMQEYMMELVYYLRDSFPAGRGVYFDLDIQAISLDVVQAVPVGLILNEVITNIFKHAFPYGDEDRIIIRFSKSFAGETELVIADNGRGLPPGYDPGQSGTFGMLLIHGLVEDLDGQLVIETRNGTAYRIRFGSEWPQRDGKGQPAELAEEIKFSRIEL